MKQIYHHYTNWEEWENGMWRKVSNEEHDIYLKKAIKFTGNAKLYGNFMMKVIEQWPISCEQNLTNISINRQAWIGHAACCIAINCPENITREAWWHLSERQQNEANRKADFAIKTWENKYLKNKDNQLCLKFD